MKASASILSFTLLASTAAAYPSTKATNATETWGVYYCTEAPWTGSCKLSHLGHADCVNLTAPYSDKVSSMGADEGIRCWLMQDCNADKDYLDISYPGYANLANTTASKWLQFADSIFCE